MPNIKEIALTLAERIYGTRFEEGYPSGNRIIEFSEAIIAEIAKQNEPVAEFLGYAALGTGQYLLNACPATDGLPPELVISVATEDEKVGRVIGDLKYVTPGTEIHPKDMAVRLAFFSVAGLDALEQQLRILREESFPDTIQPTASQIEQETAEAWQPIETAPKDKELLVFNGEYGFMKFISGEDYALWVWCDQLLSDADPYPVQPTHWMPLPTPPKRSMEGV